MSQHFPSEAAAGGGGESSTDGGAAGGLLPFYHVPQQSRREKLRYPPPPCTVDVVDPSLFNMATASTSFLQNPNLGYSSGNPQPQFEVEELQYQHQHLFPQRLVRGPAEPFTGYAAVLKASRFLRPAQQLLEEICDMGLMLQPCTDASLGDSPSLAADDPNSPYGERRRTKTRLISMLDEVCRRYKQYYQQVLDVVASFESVAGLRNAAPYTSLALNSMTRHFRSLKNAISEQLNFTDRVPGKEGHSKDELPGFGILNGGLCFPGTSARASGTMIQPNIWRPQRGLPERSVSVLKAWLFEHFLHPYPSDADKHMLARQTGLSRNQVSNWFINARVRLWKPLVEEIHALEMRQGRKGSDQASFNGGTSAQANVPSTSNHQSSEQASQDTRDPGNPPKRFRNELAQMSNHMEEQMGFSFNEFSSSRASAALLPGSGNGGVSLTLGLHQNNNGVCLPEALPFNIARRFGLEDSSTHYAVGGFEVQDRHFGKDMDGQLLRDFGG